MSNTLPNRIGNCASMQWSETQIKPTKGKILSDRNCQICRQDTTKKNIFNQKKQAIKFISVGATLIATGVGTAAAQSNELDQIVVTAQKREQGVNSVPMTITAVSGETLEKQQINSVADLAEVVPGLTYSTTKSTNPVYTIRGVGFYEQSLAAYPAVSVYLDEIPLPFPALSNHTNFDLERVEVLKGPQGTLFGSNSTGGAINYIMAKPTDQFSAGIDLTYGRFNTTYVDGFVSGPISKNVNSRLAVRFERADGWQKSTTRFNGQPGELSTSTNGEINNIMGRLLTDFSPSDRMKFELSLIAWKDRSETQAPQFIGIQSGQAPEFLSPLVENAPLSQLNNRAADWTPGLPYRDNTYYQGALRGEIDITDDISLTSLTSYINYDQQQGQDLDALPISSLDFPEDFGSIETFTQELRIANGPGNTFRWLLGANIERSSVDEDLHLYFPESSTFYSLSAAGYPATGDHFGSEQTMRNWAIFASSELDLSPTFTLRAGARYTESYREATGCNADAVPPGWTGQFFYDVLAGGSYGDYPLDTCFAINNIADDLHLDSTPIGAPGEFRGELDENNLSWTVGPQWQPSSELLLYATASKGFKAGSFPSLGASGFVQYLPVVQESVLAFEAGLKATLFNGSTQFNSAAFYYDYKDKQLLSKVVDPVFGTLDALQNIPESSVYGIEAEIITQPFQGLLARFAGSYTEGQVDSFVGFNSAGVQSNFADTPMPLSPKWQFSADIEYSFPLASGYEGYIGGNLSNRSSTISIVGGNITPAAYRGEVVDPYTIDGYTLVGARMGITSPNGSWRGELWAKNIFNEYYWYDTVQTTGDTVSRYAGMPATFGITLGYAFD